MLLRVSPVAKRPNACSPWRHVIKGIPVARRNQKRVRRSDRLPRKRCFTRPNPSVASHLLPDAAAQVRGPLFFFFRIRRGTRLARRIFFHESFDFPLSHIESCRQHTAYCLSVCSTINTHRASAKVFCANPPFFVWKHRPRKLQCLVLPPVFGAVQRRLHASIRSIGKESPAGLVK